MRVFRIPKLSGGRLVQVSHLVELLRLLLK